jgi:tetratricopeptide (TPR) repeat protein
MEMSEIVAMLQAGRHAELQAKVQTALQSEPNSAILWKALSVALSLQGADALQASRQAVALLPDDAEAHANLGDASLRAARFVEAAASYRRALDLSPGSAEVCNNLGNALRGLGKTDEATACYRQAIEKNANFADGYNNLANALRSLGRRDEAIANYGRALEIKPCYPEAWNNLGNVLLDLKRFGDAAQSYRRALETRADFAEAHSNLGNALRGLGQLEDAAASYGRALTVKPDFAAAHCNLADTQRDLGQLAAAAASCARAIELAPNLAAARNSAGNVLLDLGRLDEAEAQYRHALALDPNFAAAAINLALLLRRRGAAPEAEAYCRAALAARPDAAEACVLLAELQADAGDFQAAENLFERALTIDPESPEACAGMAHLRRMTQSDAAWLERAQRVAQLPLPPKRAVYLRFALGKYFDDVKDYPRAFENFRLAHELNRTFGAAYDRRQQTVAADHLIEFYDAAWASGVGRPASEPARPVFIVGMPRSGTTLAEQILGAHPAGFPAGELAYWDDAAREFHAAMKRGDARREIVARLGGEYLELLKSLCGDAERVIDKMPANFWHLGLIHEALPNARIIHMQRDPVDTCLSVYFQHFKSALPYADDMHDLAHFHGEYRRMMRHWRATLSNEVLLEVPYESLVADQETWTRRMLQFIGLSWDSRCLDFHQISRSVMTASKWQVRQKMHRDSIRRWKNYEPFIAPLLTLPAAQ